MCIEMNALASLNTCAVVVYLLYVVPVPAVRTGRTLGSSLRFLRFCTSRNPNASAPPLPLRFIYERDENDVVSGGPAVHNGTQLTSGGWFYYALSFISSWTYVLRLVVACDQRHDERGKSMRRWVPYRIVQIVGDLCND